MNRDKSKNGRGKSRNSITPECWNCGKTGHLKKNYRTPKKNEDKNDAANVITDEVHDALILSVDDLRDSWDWIRHRSTLRHNMIY